MSDYQNLLAKKPLFQEIFEKELKIAEEILPIKHASATAIQRLFRGAFSRVRLTKKNFAASEVQRVFRGHLGRKRSANARKSRQQTRHQAFLHYLCLQIQRCFRGYYSRKYKQDQHRRKLYCLMLAQKGEAIAEQMQQYALEQASQLEEDARQKRKEEFESLAKNLHHLTSTKHIRGIYNPVFNLVETPTMNFLPVEHHIRAVVKDLLRTRGYTKKGLTPDVNGTLRIPLSVLKQRLSVQASSHYDALRNAEREQRLHHKYATMSTKNFLGGGKTRIIDNKEVPLAAGGEPFMDAWANPLLVKGVPQNQKELLESARLQKPIFAAPPVKPFVSHVGGNRSTTLPNDLFDVIADAQETGGAVQRHLGTGTTRFGLPESCDTRSKVATSLNIYPTRTVNGGAPDAPPRANVTLCSTEARLIRPTIKIKSKANRAASGVVTRFASAMAAAALEAEQEMDGDSSEEEEPLKFPSPAVASKVS